MIIAEVIGYEGDLVKIKKNDYQALAIQPVGNNEQLISTKFRVGDQVLIDFVDGDKELPIVIGAVIQPTSEQNITIRNEEKNSIEIKERELNIHTNSDAQFKLSNSKLKLGNKEVDLIEELLKVTKIIQSTSDQFVISAAGNGTLNPEVQNKLSKLVRYLKESSQSV